MTQIIVVGAGITGVTTAYALARQGYTVSVLDRQRYPAMETSYANGGQLSACNAEVWNNAGTLLKGLKWMLKRDAPLLLNPRPSWHKYSWLAEFVGQLRNYRANTVDTVRLAIKARQHLFEIAEREKIEFNLECRGILHVYHDKPSFEIASRVNRMLVEGGLDRYSVTSEEIRSIEPALQGSYFGGYFTPSDSTGDIHKFTQGLAEACKRLGVTFHQGADVKDIKVGRDGVRVGLTASQQAMAAGALINPGSLTGDAIVVCAGVGSRAVGAMVGDRLNVYPVKGYSITVHLDDAWSAAQAPWVSLLDESAKIVTSRLGADRFRVAGTAEFNGFNRDIRADRIAPLVAWVRRNFRIDTNRVVPWAGLRPMMPDMMPRVACGRAPRVFYNTGHGHLGWTLSAATAAMIAERIKVAFPVG